MKALAWEHSFPPAWELAFLWGRVSSPQVLVRVPSPGQGFSYMQEASGVV